MSGAEVARGPASRAGASPDLFAALRESYGIYDDAPARDLGGSSNLNLLLVAGRRCYVARVYRPWVTAARLADMQLVRRHLVQGGVPCALPILTLSGDSWISVDGRLVEVEPYRESDAKMDSWPRLEVGLPLLGRIHSLLRPLVVSAAGRSPPATNNIAPADVLPGTLHGTRCLRQWSPTSGFLQLAAAAEKLAQVVDQAERTLPRLPHQLVHGDYWDNNVLFRHGRVVLVADLDFMGERARVDDLALTLYYTNSTFQEDQTSDARVQQLHRLVAAYEAGADEPLTSAERIALPVALARTPLAFIAMIAAVDSEMVARRLAAEIMPDVAWALAIMGALDRWQSALA